MASACLFCGLPFTRAPYNRQRSKEHAYPKWLEEYAPGGNFRAALSSKPADPTITEHFVAEHWYDQTVKGICVGCNTGWMEQHLEAPVRPVLIPLLQGDRPLITADDQAILARWAWKTGAMINLLNPPREHAVTTAEYRYLMQHSRPPPRALVWIGEYGPPDKYSHSWLAWVGVTGTPEPPAEKRPNAYIVSFIVGRVFFSIFGTTIITRSTPRWTFPAPSLPASGRSSPPGAPFVWPPGASVTDDIFEGVLVGLGQSGPRL